MIVSFGFMGMLLASLAYGDCYQKISQGKDSISYQVASEYIEANEKSIKQTSKLALNHLLKKLKCSEIEFSNFKCSQILREQEESEVCYVRSEIGYFIVNKDYLGNANIIFNRFD